MGMGILMCFGFFWERAVEFVFSNACWQLLMTAVCTLGGTHKSAAPSVTILRAKASQVLAGYSSRALCEEEFHRNAASVGVARPIPVSWINIPVVSETLGEDDEEVMKIQSWPIMLPSDIVPWPPQRTCIHVAVYIRF